MNSRALHRFAVFTAIATFALLGAGGLVTSHGVGMAVPDWPNTFGYNMFFFPFSQWVGGVFYEHSHRLIASGVGICTTILAIWLHGKSARPFLRWTGFVLLALGAGTLVAASGHRGDAAVLGLSGSVAVAASLTWPRCESSKPWLRRLGTIAFVAVVLQGILGGLRVVLFKDQIGIFHATLAQLFFALTCALALFTSRWWDERARRRVPVNADMEDCAGTGRNACSLKLGWLCLGATGLILAQLILGATMRHQHAGLAIPDFPLAYGKVWPAIDPQSVARYNQQRMEIVAVNAITASQIVLQLVHRLLAVLIFFAIAYSAWLARRQFSAKHPVVRLSLGWLALVVTQILLGAATIWSNKAADIATAHVLVGALSLTVGAILSIILLEQAAFARRWALDPARPTVKPSGPFGVRPSPALGLE